MQDEPKPLDVLASTCRFDSMAKRLATRLRCDARDLGEYPNGQDILNVYHGLLNTNMLNPDWKTADIQLQRFDRSYASYIAACYLFGELMTYEHRSILANSPVPLPKHLQSLAHEHAKLEQLEKTFTDQLSELYSRMRDYMNIQELCYLSAHYSRDEIIRGTDDGKPVSKNKSLQQALQDGRFSAPLDMVATQATDRLNQQFNLVQATTNTMKLTMDALPQHMHASASVDSVRLYCTELLYPRLSDLHQLGVAELYHVYSLGEAASRSGDNIEIFPSASKPIPEMRVTAAELDARLASGKDTNVVRFPGKG